MSDFRTNPVRAADAKNHFGEILDRVRDGEEVTIFSRGRAIAKIVPVTRSGTPKRSSRAARVKAIAEIERLAKGNKLRGLRVKDLINEGRR